MKPQEISDYLRENYSRIDNILLTVVTCSILLEKAVADHEGMPVEVLIVSETLNTLKESLNEQELLTVQMLLAEIDRLSDADE